MLPQFFDSVLSLVVQTSTDLPPDVRAAMKVADGRGAAGHAVRRRRCDHRAEHRPRGRLRRRHLPGHRHADLRGEDAGRREPDRDEETDPRRGRRSHQARQAAAQLGGFDHRRKLRQQSRARHADHPLRAVGERRRDRGEADPQRRRLRKHERAVLAADGAAEPRSRRSHARGRAQVHPARRVERAGQRLRARRDRRLHRRRSHVGLRARERTVVPHARRCESRSAPRGARSVDHGRGEQARHRHDGVRRPRVADRLQDRRAESPAGELLRLGCVRLLGVPPPWRRPRRRKTGAIKRWLYRDPANPVDRDGGSGGLPADRARGRAAARRSPKSRCDRSRLATSCWCRAVLTPVAMPCTIT